MSLSQPISRALSRSLGGRIGSSGTASPPQVIELTLTEYPDNTVDLAWTDPVTRTEGTYEVRQNGVLVDTLAYDDPLTHAGAVITNPVEHARWQVLYLNAAASVQARSNVATAVGLAFYAKSLRDFEHAVSITGRRLVAASNQYLEAAHASDLNFTTAMSVLVWCKKAQTANQKNCHILSKGTRSGGDLVWGLYGGNYDTLGGDSISFLTDVSTTGQAAEAGDYVGALGWTFAPNTLKSFRNGALVATTTTSGSIPASLSTNSQPLRIGVDGHASNPNFDGTIPTLGFWNRTVADADFLTLVSGDRPPRYEELEALVPGITTGLVRWWDFDSLTDQVVGDTLTEHGTGTIDEEDLITEVTDRSNGLVYIAPAGRWPKLNVDPAIMNGMPTAFHDALANENGVVGHSRCSLRAAIDQDDLIYTEPTGRVISTVRYTTALHGTENWYDAVDNGGEIAYDLGGYIAISSTRRHARRYRNYGASNGEWHSVREPVIGTDYKEDWSFDGTSFIFGLNNSLETAIPLFNGTTPAWISEIDSQQFSGTTLSGGSCALGHVGPAIKFDGYPSDLVNAKVDAWLGGFYGFDATESDYDGELFAQAIEATGYVYDPDDRWADISWFANMRRDGILPFIKEWVFFGFGTAAANAVKWISRTSGTFGGTVDHSVAGKVTFGASGRFNPDRNISQLGLGAADNCGLALIFANNDATSTLYDLAMTDGTSKLFELTANYNFSGRLGVFRFGGFDANTAISANLTSLPSVVGIWQMARSGANAFAAFNDYSTDTTVASSSSLSGGLLNNINPVLGALNTNGSLSNYSQRAYRGYGITLGMTDALGLLFRANCKTWLQARNFV